MAKHLCATIRGNWRGKIQSHVIFGIFGEEVELHVRETFFRLEVAAGVKVAGGIF